MRKSNNKLLICQIKILKKNQASPPLRLTKKHASVNTASQVNNGKPICSSWLQTQT